MNPAQQPSRVEVRRLASGRDALFLNGQKVTGSAHLNVCRDQFNKVVWVDVRFYMPIYIEPKPAPPAPRHPWVQRFMDNLKGSS